MITNFISAMLNYTKFVVHQLISDMSYFIKTQQHHYAAHVIHMLLSRALKMLITHNDYYTRKGHPSKTLQDLIVENKNLTLNQYCSLALSKKSEIDMRLSLLL